jgi:hypothetical protein
MPEPGVDRMSIERAEWRKADDGWIAAKAEVERLRSENEWLHRQRVGGQ